MVLKPKLQPEVANQWLYTVQTVLNFGAGSLCCKITLIWLVSSLSVVTILYNVYLLWVTLLLLCAHLFYCLAMTVKVVLLKFTVLF